MRAFILAVAGLAVGVAACGSYGTSTMEVEKPAGVAAVQITLPSPSLIAGQTQRANAAVKDANGAALSGRAITWYSSSASIATVSDSGVISGVAPGTATVSAVSEGVAGQAAMTVIPRPPIPVAKVLVAINPPTIIVGQTAHASVALQDSIGNPLTDRAVTWQSGNARVATVSTAGDISAVAPGTATITAASEGKTASASLSVTAPAPVPVATVSVSPASSSIQVGATVPLSATTSDSSGAILTGRVVTWSSANAGIASVNTNGVVSAASAGTTQITASSEGKSGSATIIVSAAAPAPVATVSVSPASSSIQVGATVPLSATTRDVNGTILTGRVVTWTSSNGAIASVSSTGLVTALAVGPATITATSETKSGTATISVQTPPPPGSDTLWRRNEPTGMTFIDERGFNSLTEGDSPHAPFWFRGGGSIATDASAPHSASNVLRGNYPTGFIGGSASLQNGVEGQGISNRTFYIGWWAKYSSNWFGHLTGVNKQAYFAANGSAGQAFFEANGVGTNPLRPVMVLQSGYATDATFYPNLVPGAVIPRNQWFFIEVVLVGNTSGNSDGSFDWYLNGVHVGTKSGLKITTTATGWDRFNWNPIWGGAGDIVPATQTIDLDHVYLSGKN